METAIKQRQHLKDYINDDLTNFLEDKKQTSFNTYKSYKTDIEQFCNQMYGKEPQFVTVEELEGTTGNDLVQYKNILRSNMKIATVNRKINSVRSFFSYMETDNPRIRTAIFNKVKNTKATDKKGWGILSFDEMFHMIELAEPRHGKEFSLLLELGFITGIRLEALLSLTYNDHFFREEEDGERVWVIRVWDKTEWNIKSISDELKEKLDEIVSNDSHKVFANYNQHKVGRQLRDLCKRMKIDERRNISFHSIKKTSINYVYKRTGDLKQAQQQGNHKSSTTTLDSYMEEENRLTKMASYTNGKDVDISPLEEIDKFELIDIIDKLDIATKIKIMKLAKK